MSSESHCVLYHFRSQKQRPNAISSEISPSPFLIPLTLCSTPTGHASAVSNYTKPSFRQISVVMACEASRNGNGGLLKTIGVIQLKSIKEPHGSGFCQKLTKLDSKTLRMVWLKRSSGHFSKPLPCRRMPFLWVPQSKIKNLHAITTVQTHHAHAAYLRHDQRITDKFQKDALCESSRARHGNSQNALRPNDDILPLCHHSRMDLSKCRREQQICQLLPYTLVLATY